ncbi:ABC transporter ATP-binding protein [Paenibacillus methanolicus]|uniref:ATP-binding cassette subfamily B protein AbcA/BmrA n=1 Tax=Paenibacillus methanolicus TaxID=582686 RepID=A0A5S5CBM9_9BACL|nr:ABC transporter ATP-binding protein [Paenibacillus methanolicus]TYP76775.1 ATP-binding cassette subfamily B protein AbcA/BmrA [Paenibacillus methanolicus]
MNTSNTSGKQTNVEDQLSKTKLSHFAALLFSAGIPKLTLGIAILLSLISAMAGLVVPLVTGSMIDQFRLASINAAMVLKLVFFFILQAISSGVSYLLLAYVGSRIVSHLRKKLWKKTLALPVPFFDRHRSADLMSRVANDTNEIKLFITDHLIAFCSNLLTVISAVAILFYLDWQMTLIILLALPIGIAFLMPMGDKLYAISVNMQEQLAGLAATLSQVLGEIRLVKSSNSEWREMKNGESDIDGLYRFEMKEARINAVLTPLMTLIMIVLLVVIIGYGGVRVSSGALSTGALVSFILLLFQILFPFSQFAAFFSHLKKVMGATERLRLILEHPPETKTHVQLLPDKQQPMEFRSIRFGYQKEKPILLDVSFTIPHCKVTALVGPSGSGKTTIFSLIERFYEPAEGTISWGDSAIGDFPLDAWRRKIGYVSQESPLMAGTIRDNIIYGREDEVSEEEIIEAARLAYAHDFIHALPGKYETEVGERGIRLSGGQRQRIAIARALLRKPDLLLLDEATASLDSDSEHEVQKALDYLMQDRTTLIIAHRLSTVVRADQIVVLEHGQVTGVGTHEELVHTHPSYKTWAHKQFQFDQFISMG